MRRKCCRPKGFGGNAMGCVAAPQRPPGWLRRGVSPLTPPPKRALMGVSGRIPRACLVLLIAGWAYAQTPEPAEAPAPGAPTDTAFQQTDEPQIDPDGYSQLSSELEAEAEAEPPISTSPAPGAQSEVDPADAELMKEVGGYMYRQDPADEFAADGGDRVFSRPDPMYLSVIKAVSGLCFILFLIWLTAYLFRRFAKHTPLLAGSALGTPLGKICLAPRTYLHYVRTAGKVLVIAVSPNATSLIAEFDEAEFDGETVVPQAPASEAQSPAPGAPASPQPAVSFQDQLQAGLTEINRNGSDHIAEDEEIAALHDDVRRLQRLLQEGASGDND
ncbi:MAG: hypothetical protein GWP08_04490 [Nitrospiraceae bacterium]|nr:hypothetical protein [Nitrospiraceae bacterium]